MKLLTTQENLNKLKRFDLVQLECEYCGKCFSIEKRRVDEVMLYNLRPNRFRFCSKQCSYKGKVTSFKTNCSQCGKEVIKYNYKKTKNKNYFCGLSCNSTYQNTHKTHGAKRSNLEKWIEEKLILLYPNLDFHFNRKDTITSELDIYIPSLRLAFELNGIFHYEPIYGKDRLKRSMENDDRKFLKCQELNISLCVIATHEFSHNNKKPERSQKYLDIITSIINQHS